MGVPFMAGDFGIAGHFIRGVLKKGGDKKNRTDFPGMEMIILREFVVSIFLHSRSSLHHEYHKRKQQYLIS